MPVSDSKRAFGRLFVDLVKSNKNILLVNADNVGSHQLQTVRSELRGEATLLMGKNTTIRRVLSDFLARNPDHPIENLLPHIVGNVGFVFTNSDVGKVREAVEGVVVPAPARIGATAPVDVFVDPGPTNCDPGQTAWFQALNIATKINRGQIEMISRTLLFRAGERVGPSEAALLEKLGKKPFSYSLKSTVVYTNGDVFDAEVLDITEEVLTRRLLEGAALISAIGLEIGYPTKASIVHSLNNAYKALIAIHLGTAYKFDRAQAFEDFLANPGAFAPASGGGGGGDEQAAAVEEEEEEEEEESVEGAGGLFGDSSS